MPATGTRLLLVILEPLAEFKRPAAHVLRVLGQQILYTVLQGLLARLHEVRVSNSNTAQTLKLEFAPEPVQVQPFALTQPGPQISGQSTGYPPEGAPGCRNFSSRVSPPIVVLGVREHKRRVSGIRRGPLFLLCLTSFATTKPRPSKARQSKSPHAHGPFTAQSLPGHAHMNFSGRLDPKTGKPHQQLQVICDQGHTAFTSKRQGTPEPLAGPLPGFGSRLKTPTSRGRDVPGLPGPINECFCTGSPKKYFPKTLRPPNRPYKPLNPCSLPLYVATLAVRPY